MPKWVEKIEKKLKKEAKEKGLKGERYNAYVWGTLKKIMEEKNGKS